MPKASRRADTDGADDVHLLELFEVIGQRWTLRILWALRAGPLTYRQLAADIPGLSTALLTGRLRDLKVVGLVRHDGAGYELTGHGRDLLTHLQRLQRWANRVEFRSDP